MHYLQEEEEMVQRRMSVGRKHKPLTGGMRNAVQEEEEEMVQIKSVGNRNH